MKLHFINILGEYLFEEKDGKIVLAEKRLFSSKDQEMILLEGIGSVKASLNGEKPDMKQLNLILNHFTGEAKALRDFNFLNTKRLVSDSVNDDNIIMQTVNVIEDMEKVLNGLIKRLREWYSLYAPEVSENINDNEGFVKAILSKDKDTLLKEFNISDSMGADLGKIDVEEIMSFAERIKTLSDEKRKKEKYLSIVMERHCPNLKALVGVMIGSKILTIAKGLRRMSLMPAGTIQLLGAEVALFRHLKTGARTPKHGFIITHPIVARVPRKDKGKVARVLADKISICVKVDYFKGEPIGEKLRMDLEQKYQ